MDDIFMVMEFMEHDLKGLMEGQETNGVFAMSEVSSQASPASVSCSQTTLHPTAECQSQLC